MIKDLDLSDKVRVWIEGQPLPFSGEVYSNTDEELELGYAHVVTSSDGKATVTHRSCFIKTSKIIAYEIEGMTKCKTHH